MRIKNYSKNIKTLCIALLICCSSFTVFSQTIYTNDMEYVLADVKQVFITNKVLTEAHADNLLTAFTEMKVNGIRIPLFGRDTNGVDLNPNKPMFDYFYTQALAQGFVIFANPAQGGGGARVANNMLNGDVPSVNGVQAATDELIARVLEFSAEYPDCKWLNPFNEDGRATSSTWSVDQIHEIYSTLYNNVNGAELIGPCTWGLPAAIDMFNNTNIEDYITVAASHNLGFNHGQWSTFINLAKAKNLPVWDSEVNHNDAKGNGTRLEKAIENKVDGLVLYNAANAVNLNNGTLTNAVYTWMDLYLKDEAQPVNIAPTGIATQSSTNPSFNKGPELAIDGDTNGNFGGGSVTVTNGEANPWWQVDFGSDKGIGDIKVFNRTDGCCKARMSNFTVSVINSNNETVYSKTYADYPDQYIIAETGGVLGQIVRIDLDNGTNALTLAEVEVYASEITLSTAVIDNVEVKIYPNPVSEKLMISTPSAAFQNYTLYNISGQVVLTNEINTKDVEVNVSALSKGLYLLKLDGLNSSKMLKVVKD